MFFKYFMNSFLAKRSVASVVDKATQDDQVPTPGFLYNEINKVSFGSVEQCQHLQDLLLGKLQNESPDVRFKALRVIKQLLLKGHRSFRTEIQRRTQELQSCLEFRAPSDPLRGDKPSERVREESKDIMKMIFQNEPNNSVPYASEQASTSFGSSSISHRISGTGNFIPPEDTSSGIFSKIKESSIKLAATVRGESSSEEFDPHKHWSSSNFALSNDSRPLTTQTVNQEYYSIGERTTKKGVPGGSWAQPELHLHSELEEEKKEDIDISEITPESILVDKMTTPGGVRTALSRMEVNQFIRKCSELEIERISILLSLKVKDLKWQTVLKSLCLIEGLINKQVEGFQPSTDIILPLLHSPQTSVKSKAQHILQLLHYEEEPSKEEEEEQQQQDLMPYNQTNELFAGLQLKDNTNKEVSPEPSEDK